MGWSVFAALAVGVGAAIWFWRKARKSERNKLRALKAEEVIDDLEDIHRDIADPDIRQRVRDDLTK